MTKGLPKQLVPVNKLKKLQDLEPYFDLESERSWRWYYHSTHYLDDQGDEKLQEELSQVFSCGEIIELDQLNERLRDLKQLAIQEFAQDKEKLLKLHNKLGDMKLVVDADYVNRLTVCFYAVETDQDLFVRLRNKIKEHNQQFSKEERERAKYRELKKKFEGATNG